MRHEKDVVITAKGRDHGKTYYLTEMSAAKAEKWAARAVLAVSRGGLAIPEDYRSAGLAELAAIAARGLFMVDFVDAEPLMDEMMGCVQIKEKLVTRPLVDGDIEEVSTLIKLRGEVLDLHLGFSLAEKLSQLTSAKTGDGTPNTSTSAVE